VIYLFVKRNRTATVDGSYEAGSRILHTQTWKLLRKEARAQRDETFKREPYLFLSAR